MATDDNIISDLKNDKTSVEGQSGDDKGASEKQPLSEDTVNEKSDVKPVPSPKTKSNASTESSATEQSAPDSKLESRISELEENLKQAEQKAKDNWDEVLRARADLENTRKRMERDIENAHKYAVEKFVQGLLPVIDSLEMGLAAANQEGANISSVKEGTELTLKMFADCVDKFGMQAVDPTGEKFNPEFHQAMTIQESSDHAPDTVIAVMQKGYLLNGRLIRPAMVVVAKSGGAGAGSAEKTAGEQENSEKNT